MVSLIGLAGPWVGSGSLSCTAAFACKIASHFLSTEYAAINEDVLDSVAEVTNMIIGNVKTKLEGKTEDGRLDFHYQEPEARGQGWFELAPDGMAFAGQWCADGRDLWQPWAGS